MVEALNFFALETDLIVIAFLYHLQIRKFRLVIMRKDAALDLTDFAVECRHDVMFEI